MRRPGSAVKRSSNVLSRVPCAAAANWAESQRRAAPIPRVSDLVSDRVCRVPNPTSFATVACSGAGSMRCRMASIRGSRRAGASAASSKTSSIDVPSTAK